MKAHHVMLTALTLVALAIVGCTSDNPVEVSASSGSETFDAISSDESILHKGPSDQACWGQATKVFAQMGEMGEHASQQPTPRLGLRNVARALYEEGILPDDSMQSLGAFLSDVLGLSIDACL